MLFARIAQPMLRCPPSQPLRVDWTFSRKEALLVV